MKIKNKIISLLLVVAVLFSVTCISVAARTLIVSGDWKFERINDNRECQVAEYTGSDEIVTVYRFFGTTPITSIGSYAFIANKTVKEITLSSVLKDIQNSAFVGASSLEKIILTSKVQMIGYSAFSGCTSLYDINLEDTVITEVSSSCFYGCDSLAEITLPDTATSINANAFAYCDNLSKITIPASVTAIADNAFYSTPNVVIYCYRDSAAHVYAEANSIEYVLLDPEPTVPETQPTEPTDPTVPETQPTEPTEPVRTYILGDIDCDGEITVMDATRIQLILVERIKDYTEEDVIRGDIERDGVLSIMDVTSIQRYSASYDDGLGIGETFEF